MKNSAPHKKVHVATKVHSADANARPMRQGILPRFSIGRRYNAISSSRGEAHEKSNTPSSGRLTIATGPITRGFISKSIDTK